MLNDIFSEVFVLVAVATTLVVIGGLLKIASYFHDRIERKRLADEEHRMIVQYYADLRRQHRQLEQMILEEPKDSIGE